MTRGTTPLHIFKFPDDINENYLNILITYRQNGETVIEKKLDDLDIVGNVANLRLTQVETYSFDVGTGYVQLKAFTKDKRVLPSAVFSFPVTSSLNDDVFLDDGQIYITTDSSDYKNEETFTIVRGTTPTLYYVPNICSVDDIDVIYLIIKQFRKTVIEKTKVDAEIIDNSMFAWMLSQEETLSLRPWHPATVSCVWKLTNGMRGESQLTVCEVIDGAKDEVI